MSGYNTPAPAADVAAFDFDSAPVVQAVDGATHAPAAAHPRAEGGGMAVPLADVDFAPFVAAG